jgi:hypothetical protein
MDELCARQRTRSGIAQSVADGNQPLDQAGLRGGPRVHRAFNKSRTRISGQDSKSYRQAILVTPSPLPTHSCRRRPAPIHVSARVRPGEWIPASKPVKQLECRHPWGKRAITPTCRPGLYARDPSLSELRSVGRGDSLAASNHAPEYAEPWIPGTRPGMTPVRAISSHAPPPG